MNSKIYTKTGDHGTTGLLGGDRVDKSDIRLEAYGTVDELNSWIGVLRSLIDDTAVRDLLLTIQNNLFITGSKLASDERGKVITGKFTIPEKEILMLEEAIDSYEEKLTPLQNFILPGGSRLSAFCHVTRTVCRRAERRIAALSHSAKVDKTILVYINRLSDYLFVLSRKIASDGGTEELSWKPPA